MRASDLTPSKYLEAANIGDDVGSEVVVTIKDIGFCEVGNDEDKSIKGSLYFEEFKKWMVLNRTNGKRLQLLLGGETDDWKGKRITLYRSEADFQGTVRPCIRVRDKLPKALPHLAAGD